MKRIEPKERPLIPPSQSRGRPGASAHHIDQNGPPQLLTRIYIDAGGNCIVTDLWEEIGDLLKTDFSQGEAAILPRGE